MNSLVYLTLRWCPRFFSEFFDFTLPISFHQTSPYSYITWGTNNRTVGGRRKETTCHPIDMKSSNNTWAPREVNERGLLRACCKSQHKRWRKAAYWCCFLDVDTYGQRSRSQTCYPQFLFWPNENCTINRQHRTFQTYETCIKSATSTRRSVSGSCSRAE
jgi:hypothetical protein